MILYVADYVVYVCKGGCGISIGKLILKIVIFKIVQCLTAAWCIKNYHIESFSVIIINLYL